MPYIKNENRTRYDKTVKKLAKKIAKRGHQEGYQTLAGDLNYCISTLLQRVHLEDDTGAYSRTLNYSDYNEIIGVLECIKLEFYRKQTAPYEDQKIEENGDIFPNHQTEYGKKLLEKFNEELDELCDD